MAGNWKYSQFIEPSTPEWIEYYSIPTLIYNAKIAPLVPFTLKGIVWFQGESNAEKPHDYNTLFSMLIQSWRNQWHNQQLPFVFAQLANSGIRDSMPAESKISLIREAQQQALNIPYTAMVTTLDLSTDGDVHFSNKASCGQRFAMAAMPFVSTTMAACRPPVFLRSEVDGSSIKLYFDNAIGGLLTANNEPPANFAIAGSDSIYVWANAKIASNCIEVWNKAIKKPVAVRFAWADNPYCNVYNTCGMPLGTFSVKIKDAKINTKSKSSNN